MAIFRRDNPPEDTTPPARPRPPRDLPAPEIRRTATYIAAGSHFIGELTGEAEVLVEGHVEGKIRLESAVTVGREGKVQGEVQARSVRVEGRVEGNVRGLERVEVLATGSLEGDISASRVVIAEGAFFKGNVEMTGAGKKQDGSGSAKPGAASDAPLEPGRTATGASSGGGNKGPHNAGKKGGS
ncbi:MAG: polymer-forming cytoskeletal protein [Acidobacteria bacterium]|nr:polymer-forming cytoskeletal protein [Acidobacteriota bacterium]